MKSMSDEKRFRLIVTIILTLFSIVALFPMILLVVASFTDENELITHGYQILPRKLSLEAYSYMVKQASTIIRAYLVTIGTTIAGTALSIFLTSSIAYPMARKNFKYRNALSFFVYFTMLFNGGLVPQYIMWTTFFHIKNTYFALVIPNLLMTAFNIFLVRNYYSNSLPEALFEAAQLDGASEFGIYTKVVFPLSKPVIATVGLFVALAYWNSWTNALYYVTDPKYFGIQNLLMRIMKNIEYLRTGAAEMSAEGQAVTLPGNSIRMALAFVGILPIVIIYPMLQKYFIKGVVVGAVKG
ncbi:carbohydrate ABC transporter permease [Parablautia intestinalis]|jgi:putative aldouronate transport system permease protein|uniref:Carbohydrate ABC transporter permease n=1 Tax=Parablautia intestinalis TaxID=2320100 RepID=A0A3A9AL88_9FIRM|nr:carbohydrate ABC transporter permease [Parablautia intestinalis]MCI8615579.1 carbohydrate ABC transporter permease [Lachnospiraceae bacterium]MDE7049239.1 carbohydrate ABC transporter permease [Lachnospiraceae bacterium]RKI88066.1 carbohydrate ABC transporter permease [Parablautia intestinalis]